MGDTIDRRRHRRHPVQAALHCRRLGRGGFDEEVTSADLSAGGCLLRADRRLAIGDVLVLDVELGGVAVALKGLVVASREVPGHPDERLVHIAFTGLSPERVQALGDLLDAWERETEGSASR